jgi:UPF0042 nucleotide-binding protein
VEQFNGPGAGHDIVIVTGPAGAGRTTAIRALEDFGFEAIDNLPLSLMPRLVAGPPMQKPLVVGLDPRNRDFAIDALTDMLDELGARPGCRPVLAYIDCAAAVLVQRYNETRRRHPSSPNESPGIGIERETQLLAPLRDRADVLIDTTALNVHELRAELARWFAPGESGAGLAVSVESFSYARGLPRGADMVMDCRFLRNPHWNAELRAQDGRDPEVSAYVAGDPTCEPFVGRLLEMLRFLLPRYEAEGKSYFTVALGCTGGKHRSVALAELIGNSLAQDGWRMSIRHRDLERTVASALFQRTSAT